MKKLLYIIPASLLFFALFSCNKKLDVKSQNSAAADQIQTSGDVEAVLFGAYAALQNYGAFGEQFTLIPDLIADSAQVTWVGTYPEYKDVQTKAALSTDYIMATCWGNAYKIIGITNTVIDKLNLVDTADQAVIQGEAEFIRGMTYYELLGIYALPYSDGNAANNPGVPLVTTPVYAYDETKDKPARATVAAVYAQIVSDLKDAIAKLPTSSSNYRATLYSAEAILSRVYLSMQDYTNAAIMANDVIVNGGFSLVNPFSKAFNNTSNSPEDIFAIQQNAQSNTGTGNQGLSAFYVPNSADAPYASIGGRGDAQVADGYYDYFESGDFRGTFVTSGTSISGFDGDYTNKYAQFYTAIPVVRLGEMYLTRGEANLATSNALGATPLEDINSIRERSGASDLGNVTVQDFADERFRELSFEGDRMWTLKRLKMTIDGLAFNDPTLVMPLPQPEIDVNKNLVQNPGY